MIRGAFTWLLLATGLFAFSSANQEALQAVTRGNNLFSSELYDVIRKSSQDNLIVSPISVATVLAMLEAGARGKTAESIRSSLHFPADENQLNSGYQSLLQQLKGDDNVTLDIVNRIYPAEGYKLNPQFTQTLKNYYNAEPHQLNYRENDEAARVINNFVSNATHARIKDLIQASDLNTDTRLVLLNAIYFKGNWKTQFPKQDTHEADFYTGESSSVKVQMMRLETDMLYGEIRELDAKAVSLPYKGDRLSMIILLPNKRTGLAEMEEKMRNFPLEKVLENLRERRVQLYLPRFKLESTIDLKDPLTKLGLGDIFSEVEADLSGIAVQKESLYVSKAVQKAFIEVNEEGSEAAAATVGPTVNGWEGKGYTGLYTGPYFDSNTPNNITAQLGTHAFLPCKVKQLGNKSISWIRKRDSHILTVDRYTFIADERFQVLHNGDTWTLQIKYVQSRDAGVYECQVTIEPKMSQFVQLDVVVPQTKILGESELFVKSGSTVQIKCIITQSLEQPAYIFWYHDGGRVVSLNGKHQSVERVNSDTTIGILVIKSAEKRDSGNYTCSPSNLDSASVLLHVLNGEHPAAMQQGSSASISYSMYSWQNALVFLLVSNMFWWPRPRT